MLLGAVLTQELPCVKIVLGDNMKNMYRKILEKLKNGIDVVLLSVVSSRGSVPRKIGAKMACFSDGESIGTVGGGAIEHEACKLAFSMSDVCLNKNYTLNHNDAEKLGMVCGGEVEINFSYVKSDAKSIELFSQIADAIENRKKAWLLTNTKNGEISLISEEEASSQKVADISDNVIKTKVVTLFDNGLYIEPLSNSSVVYVFGGGHISRALCPMLSAVDFDVVVYEDKAEFADKADFCSAQRVVCAPFTQISKNVDITSDDYAVVLTRGHKSDNEVITQILSKHPKYLGVIGSKKKVAFMHEYLQNCGFSKADIESIYSPVGLSIGAVTPAEIAVSITAQMIMVRSEKI